MRHAGQCYREMSQDMLLEIRLGDESGDVTDR